VIRSAVSSFLILLATVVVVPPAWPALYMWRGLSSSTPGADGFTFDLAPNWSPSSLPFGADIARFDVVSVTTPPLRLLAPRSVGFLEVAGTAIALDNTIALAPSSVQLGGSGGPGTMTLEAGTMASTWRIGDVADGTLNVGPTAMVNSNNTRVGIGAAGTVNLQGHWTNTGSTFIVGQGSNVGRLEITDGGTLTTAGLTGNNARIALTGPTARWFDSGTIRAGGGPTIAGGAKVESDDYEFINPARIGVGGTVSGTGSEWWVHGRLEVGQHGVLVNEGATLRTDNRVETSNFGSVTVDGPGTHWLANGEVYLGLASNGYMSIRAGGLLISTAPTRLGPVSPGYAAVSDGGTWQYSSSLGFGPSPGVLTVSSGGQVEGPGASLSLSGSDGTVTVRDPGSRWHITGNQTVAGSAPTAHEPVAHIIVEDGGEVSCAGTMSLDYGGEIEVSGGGILIADQLTLQCMSNGTFLFMSAFGGTLRTNRLNLSCLVPTIQVGNLQLGHTAGPTSSTHTVPGNATLTSKRFALGFNAQAAVVVSGNQVSEDLVVGDLAEGNGTITVGGLSTTTRDLIVGSEGTGLFRFTIGDATVGRDLIIAAEPGSMGTVEVGSGNALDVGGDAFVGGSRAGPGGSGTLRHVGNGTTTIAETLFVYPTNQVEIVSGHLSAAVIDVMGGVLANRAQITGVVINDGTATVGPEGSAFGRFLVEGDFEQEPAGTLFLRADTPALHDSMVVTGTMRLAGTLHLVMPYGLSPTVGARIRLATAAQFVGSFATVLGLPAPTSTARWELQVAGGHLELVGVSHTGPVGMPASTDLVLMLSALGLACLGAAHLRRPAQRP
jgi:T5SS/PEP-CTERM-associated repeat protein